MLRRIALRWRPVGITGPSVASEGDAMLFCSELPKWTAWP